jgi:hypothetical protein
MTRCYWKLSAKSTAPRPLLSFIGRDCGYFLRPQMRGLLRNTHRQRRRRRRLRTHVAALEIRRNIGPPFSRLCGAPRIRRCGCFCGDFWDHPLIDANQLPSANIQKPKVDANATVRSREGSPVLKMRTNVLRAAQVPATFCRRALQAEH